MDSKARILRAATDEFARHGYAGARIDRIARRAKVNKALIYYHFGSKARLYQQVLEHQVSNVVTYLKARVGKAESLEDVLLAFSEKYHEALKADSKFVPMLLREMAQGGRHIKGLLAQMINSEGELRGRILRMIDQGKQEGLYRDLDSRHAIISFAGMNLFYLLMVPLVSEIWGIEDEERFRSERPRQIVHLFLEGLKRR